MFEFGRRITKYHLLWGGVFVTALLYYGIGIGREALWFDESYSVIITRFSIPELCRLMVHDSHPPLYQVLLKGVALLGGTSESAMRFLSVLGSLGLLSLGAGPIRRLYGRFTGILFSLLVLVTPMVLYMSQEARMYAWAAFFVAGSILYGFLALRDHAKRDWVLFTGFTLAAAYTHYYALLAVMIAVVMMTGWVMFRSRVSRVPFFLSLLVICIGYLPWLPTLIQQTMMTAREFWIPPVTAKTVRTALLFPFMAASSRLIMTYFSFAGFLSVLALGLFFARRSRESLLLPFIALMTYLLTLVAAVVLSNAVRPLFVPRYIYPLIGLLFIGVAFALSVIRNRRIVWAIFVVYLLVSLPAHHRIRSRRHKGPMKEVYSYLQPHIGNDAVFVHTGIQTHGNFFYYFPDNRHYYYIPFGDTVKGTANMRWVEKIRSLKSLKGCRNLWVVEQNGKNRKSKISGWHTTGQLIKKGRERFFTTPHLWYTISVVPAAIPDL